LYSENGAKVIIENSKIHDSLWSCIDIWSANVQIKNSEIYHCWHQAIGVKRGGNVFIEQNSIHDAQLSVNCEEGAKPNIINNHFEAAPLEPHCPNGENNQNTNRAADTKGGTYEGNLIYPSE
jgi:hypothetical protein